MAIFNSYVAVYQRVNPDLFNDYMQHQLRKFCYGWL